MNMLEEKKHPKQPRPCLIFGRCYSSFRIGLVVQASGYGHQNLGL